MSAKDVFEREVRAAREHYRSTGYMGRLAGLHDRPAQREAMLQMVEDGEAWLGLLPGKVRTFNFYARPPFVPGDHCPYVSRRNKALTK